MLGTSQSSTSTANLDCVEDEKVDVKKERNIGKNKGKKPMSGDDRLENAMDSVTTKMMERQSKTDELFLELETKRMKMEEQKAGRAATGQRGKRKTRKGTQGRA